MSTLTIVSVMICLATVVLLKAYPHHPFVALLRTALVEIPASRMPVFGRVHAIMALMILAILPVGLQTVVAVGSFELALAYISYTAMYVDASIAVLLLAATTRFHMLSAVIRSIWSSKQ